VVEPLGDYSGSLNLAAFTTKIDLDPTQGIQPLKLFTAKYKVMPCSTISSSSSSMGHLYTGGRSKRFATAPTGLSHATSIIKFLTDEYKLDAGTFLSNTTYDSAQKHTLYQDIYIDLGNYLTVYLSGGYGAGSSNLDNPFELKPDTADDQFNCCSTIQVFHIPQNVDKVHQLLAQLSRFKLFMITETSLQMVCYNPQSGFYTSHISIKRPLIKDLKLNYGSEFAKVHEKLIQTLQEPDSTGITFLHGPPGTGKTYYIRYLINEIKDKSLIYVPPDLVNEMTKPGFLPFLMQHPNSILIVEDAENIILDRKDQINPNQAVSNLLNLSDGLLGDAMHQQIITTFNCDVKGIDPALLREGRLIVEHKFDKLSVEQAKCLCKELGFADDDINQPMTLAEIYSRKQQTK